MVEGNTLYHLKNLNEKTMQKVKAIQDDECHWYVVPEEKVAEFEALQEKLQGNRYLPEVEAEFDDKFSEYRTGGDLNNTQLWAKIT